jgi:hypothetical protein
MLLINSCSIRDNRSDYIVSIHYLDNDSKIDTDLRNGVIGLTFLNGFSNDSLKVIVNKKYSRRDLITTNEVTGSALTLEVDTLQNVKEISIQLNSGKCAIVKCDKNNQLFTVRFTRDSLIVNSIAFFSPHR